MIAAGIDIGGTKIEAQLFDQTWERVGSERRPTPTSYADLVATVAELVRWGEAEAGWSLPTGIGAAGLVNPATGLAFTANLAATDRPFPADIESAAGTSVTYLNDCRAMALSEAVFGQGRGHRTVVSLILGTGIGGGVCVDGTLLAGPTLTGGEFGHMSAPAHLVVEHGLPLWQCGCGREGCIETYVAGPGLARLATHMTGAKITPPEIAARRQGDMAPVWSLWCELAADLIHRLTLTLDPDVVVLGGGLSKIDSVSQDLTEAASRAQFGPFSVPRILRAQGGDASGARGAAYAAWQGAHQTGRDAHA